MKVREVWLVSQRDGSCLLKDREGGTTRAFTDALEALNFLHDSPENDAAQLTLFDAIGNAVFTTTLSCGNPRLLRGYAPR